jgi:Flp pilus assembly protein TadD
MATFSVLDAFRGAPAPAPWFRVLEIDPQKAASQLLFGTGDFSTFQAAEPLHLAMHWLREVREPGFANALDLAFHHWIETYWGDSIHPESAGSASLTADAWQNLGLILAGYPMFHASAAALRERVLAERNFLLAIGEGPTSDPAGRALQAISRYQKDRTLRDYWWELAALPPSTPWFHGEYALDGLSHLPSHGVGIPEVVPSGLRRLADALSRRVGEGWLEAKLARRYFLRIAKLTQRYFPFEEKWRPFWLGVFQSTKDENVQVWLQSLCGFRVEERDPAESRPRVFKPSPHWSDRAKAIAKKLELDDSTALQEAIVLLEEQEAYLNHTGDSNFFVRSACNFATHIIDRQPTQALEWAQRARRAEPADAYNWKIEVTCLKRIGKTSDALALAMETVDRFPEDVFAFNGLGDVLKLQGRLSDAEEVYRRAIDRFPENVVALNGLADVLKLKGRLTDAKEVYREAIDRFPDEVFAFNGLGDVLKLQGHLSDAEEVYRKTIERFPKDAVVSNGLADVLKLQGRLDGAEKIYRKAISRFPGNAVARNGLADVLRLQGRLDDAETVYRDAIDRFPWDAVSHIGLGDVLKLHGRLDDAAEAYREAVDRFPENVIARTRLEEGPMAKGRLADSEGIVEEGLRAQEIPEQNAPSEDPPPPKVITQQPELTSTKAEKAIPPSPKVSKPYPGSVEDPPESHARLAHRLRQADIEILLTDFILLRKWYPAGGSIPALRDRARALLDRVGPHLFDDAVLASERAAALLISDLDEALSFLKEASGRFPGSAKVAYAQARAERLRVRNLRPELRSDQGQQALFAWSRLARVDPAFEPLQLLGLSRTLPLLRDGMELETQTRGRLQELDFSMGRMVKHSSAGSLEQLWAKRVRKMIFAGEVIGNDDQASSLTKFINRLDECREPLDHLEMEYIDARATV